MKGLLSKYTVTKNEGDTDPEAEYFVLRVDTDRAAMVAMLTYADAVQRYGESELARDIRGWVYPKLGKTHELKTWPEYFTLVEMKVKNFEVRKNDRDFKEGDILRLQEYDPVTVVYTGNEVWRYVTYIFDNGDGYVVMQIDELEYGRLPYLEKRG